MKLRIQFGVSILLIVIAGFIGHEVSTNVHSTLHPRSQFTITRAKKVIQKFETTHSVSDIDIVNVTNVSGLGFAFATFELDGEEKYASLYASTKSTVMGMFSIDKSRNDPFVYSEQGGEHGIVQVFGAVKGQLSLKQVVIIFPDGYVALATVVHHLFWFVGKPGTAKHPIKVIGITNNGSIIQDKS